jgi:sugar phosphate isomerase/epimerase
VAMMSVGQSTGGSDMLTSLALTLDRLEHAGVEVAEIMPDRYWTLLGGGVNRERLRRLCAVLADRPLRYTMHAPFALNLFDQRHPGLQEQMFRSCLDVAAETGAEVLVYHSGRRVAGGTGGLTLDALLEIERTMLLQMAAYAEECGVLIAVENMTPTAERKAGLPDLVPYGADLRALARQINEIDHSSVGICLDFGHANLYETGMGGDLLEAVALAAPLVNHLHIHDNFGRQDDHPHYPAHADLRAIGESDLHLPIGWGRIPYQEIVTRVPFLLDPIDLSEVLTIDDDVLSETVAALKAMITANARTEGEPELAR